MCHRLPRGEGGRTPGIPGAIWVFEPRGPITYFNDWGWCPSNFFGSEILTKSDFLGRKKNNREIFLGFEKGLRNFLGIDYFLVDIEF